MKHPPADVRLVPTADVAPRPWRNGGGLTRELLAWPAPHDWVLRVSVADIEGDGPFSAYPGIERWFVVLDGQGVRLQPPGNDASLSLGTASEPYRFDGALAPDCTLRNGATRDLNLMVRRGQAVGAFDAVRAGEPRFCAAGVHALYTTVPGVLRRDDGAQWPVPAHVLAWWQAAPDGVWRFVPQAPAGALRAWWMGAMPLDT